MLGFYLEKLTAETSEADWHGGDKEIWLETSAVQMIENTSGGQQWLTQHTREQSVYKLRDPAYSLSFTRVFP